MSLVTSLLKGASKVVRPFGTEIVRPAAKTETLLKGLQYRPDLAADVVCFSARTPVNKISGNSLNRGINFLTGRASIDGAKLRPVVEECFVGIKSEADAVRLFETQFKELGKEHSLYILNPSKIEKLSQNIGTSNGYMSELYQQASRSGTIIDRTNVQTMVDNIIKNGEKKVRIVIPDDFSGSGRSMIVNTAEVLNGIKLPSDVSVEIVFSPLSRTPFAKDAMDTFARFDLDTLMKSGALNKDKLVGKKTLDIINDSDIIREFFEKYKGRVSIKSSNSIINAKPYYETEAFKILKQEDPDAAQAVELLLTEKGKGYGRPGADGTMVLVPGGEGVLKSPNNNCGGSLPFVLLEGANPGKIKNPNQKWSFKRWQEYIQRIQKALEV